MRFVLNSSGAAVSFALPSEQVSGRLYECASVVNYGRSVMRSAVIVFCYFLLLCASLGASTETEPNNTIVDTGVFWCENGTHNGTLTIVDVDYWRVECYPGDQLSFTFLGAPTNTLVCLVDANHNPLVSNFVDGIYTSGFQYDVPDGEERYFYIQNLTGMTGDYSFNISGQFISVTSDALPPSAFSIPFEATNVDVNTTQLTWRWGDGCGLGQWNLYYGVDPYNLQPLYPYFLESIDSREGSFTFPEPLAGNLTYYFVFYYTNLSGYYAAYSPYYYFTTGQRILPVPITENFDGTSNIFLNVNPNSPFMTLNLEESNPLSIAAIRVPGTMGQIVEKGTHDLSSTTAAYMSFRHACLMEPDADHGYVEYSLDGGVSWSIFPVSSYRGSGVYDWPTQNNPAGPCFDAGSYPAWADYQNISTVTPYWRTEIFDLSPWAGCQNFRVRFFTDWNANDIGLGWIIDDFSIYLQQPGVPHSPVPTAGVSGSGSYELLSWTGVNSLIYHVRLGTTPETGFEYSCTVNSFRCTGLAPSTTYYWQVRGINSVGISDWSQPWSFTTQAYSTPHHLDPNLYIAQVNAGTIANSSIFNDYTFYSGLSASVNAGSSLPITAYLVGGYGPEGIRVWVDLNNDFSFNNNPGGGEYWDFYWNGSGFSANVQIPAITPTGFYRMRIQGIHTDGGYGPSPTGVLAYGETEDYILHVIAQPQLSISPTAGSFSPALIGFNSETIRFTFSNIGGSSLDITLTGLTGSDTDCFTLAEGNSYPIHLSTNQASVDITYHPVRTGNHTANLLVRDNLSRTDHNIPLSGSAIESNPAGALCLDGSGEFLSATSAAPLQSLSAVTLETWFKWNGNNSIQFLTAKSIEELEIHTTANNGLRFIPTTQVYLDSQPNVLTPGLWQHIACVYDPASLLAKIYVDGVDVTWQNNGSNPLSCPLKSSTADFRMGLRQDYSYALAGCIDEIRIWNTALSLQQIRNNMHLWQPESAPGLVANWRLDEASGNKVWDQNGAINATLQNCEAGDRIATEVLIGQGTACTLTPSATGVPYDFTGADLQLVFSDLGSGNPITATKLSGNGNRSILNGQSWILKGYGGSLGKASLSLAVAEDITAAQLPERYFRLYARNPFSFAPWQFLRSAESVDLIDNTLQFAETDLATKQLRIQWEEVPLPQAPAALHLVKSGESIQLNWDAVPGATGYRVYSSDTPEGAFSLDSSGSFGINSWTAPVSNAKRFYRVHTETP